MRLKLLFLTAISLAALSPAPSFARDDFFVAIDPQESTPKQIGKTAYELLQGSKTQNEIVITPTNMGLRGPSVRLIKRDMQQALVKHEGSPEEIWRNTIFDSENSPQPPRENSLAFSDFKFILDNQLAFTNGIKPDTRTSFIVGARGPSFLGLIDTGGAFRVNLHENMSLEGARNTEHEFADKLVSIDHLYAAYTHSFRSNLHMSLMGGYLEEMYGGIGGEFLYRPFNSRFAIGLEGWQAWRRDPDTILSTGLDDENIFSGHVNAWYELPYELTLSAKAGRYLAKDFGATLALEKQFKNGTTLEGYLTHTAETGPDLFGDTSNFAQGIRLTIPLGGYKFMPRGAAITARAEPFARNAGSTIKNPLPLYDMTTPLAAGHMIENWNEITP